MNNNTQAVLFDLDGTLLDTAPNFIQIISSLANKYNISDFNLNHENFRYIVSKGAKFMVEDSFKKYFDQIKISELTTEFLTIYENNLLANTSIIPGIESTLMQLSDNNIKWGIVTNKAHRFTLPLINNIKCFKNCSIVVSGDTTSAKKPSPIPLLYASKQLNISPKSSIYVGDAETDIISGKASGMYTIAANFGYIHPEIDISSWGADFITANPQEIITHLMLI